MAKKAIARIEMGEGQELPIYKQVQITQNLFGHHEFQVQVPMEVIEESDVFSLNKSKQIIGKTVKINLESEQLLDTRGQLFTGIITSVSLSRFHGSGNDLVIKGKSATILLDDGLQCRSFSEKKLGDIVEEVLKDYPSNLLASKVNPAFTETIPYLVQYRESNFHFLYRIANLYGEWLFYSGSELIFGQPELPEPLNLQLGSDLFNFNLGISLQPVNFQLHAYDYINNKVLQSLASDSNIANLDAAYGKVAFEESDNLFTQSPQTLAMVPIKEQAELDQLVARKRNQQSSDMIHLRGSSDHIGLGMGVIISVAGSKTEDPFSNLEDYGQFIITSIKHRIHGNGNYLNEFDSIPKEVGLPPLNPYIRRPFSEPQPGVVKENADPEGLGRVRVQLYWQKDPEMTPWIRAVSSHGGASGGFFVIPEKGDEVMVDYEFNHPDKPFVVGSLYHGKAKPGGGWQDKDNNIKAIKTKSGNEITLTDTGGKEEIKISNKGGQNTITLTMSDGGALNISGCNAMSISAKNISIDASEDISVSAKNVTISTQQDFTLNADAKVSVNSAADTLIDSQANCNFHAAADININADSTLNAVGTSGANVNSDADLNLGAKGNANLAGEAQANVQGKLVNVTGDGATTITGKVVQLN